jgi:hypothetical protein
MTDKDIVLAYFENMRLEATADYMRRGRHLANIDMEELNRRWVAEFKRWAPNIGTGNKFDHQPREDIESEMQARGIELPWALVSDEFKAMQKASRAFTDRLARDPARFAERESDKSARTSKHSSAASKKANQTEIYRSTGSRSRNGSCSSSGIGGRPITRSGTPIDALPSITTVRPGDNPIGTLMLPIGKPRPAP